MKLTAKLRRAMRQHAADEYPNECCGIVANGEYIPCRNVSTQKDMFQIHHEDLADAEDKGAIQAYVHSHPDGTSKPSELDLHQIELHQKPWVIIGNDDIAIHKPFGYKAPLIGRNYYHGWQDCFAIVRDFYQREFDIFINDYPRVDKWWENPHTQSLYLENFANEGFKQVDINQLQYGDVILCKVQPTEHINHAVIWLGDKHDLKSEQTTPCVGTNLILHHPYNKKSCREIFGKMWLDTVIMAVRHVKND